MPTEVDDPGATVTLDIGRLAWSSVAMANERRERDLPSNFRAGQEDDDGDERMHKPVTGEERMHKPVTGEERMHKPVTGEERMHKPVTGEERMHKPVTGKGGCTSP